MDFTFNDKTGWVTIDGITDTDSNFYSNTKDISLESTDIIEKLAQYNFNELAEKFNLISFNRNIRNMIVMPVGIIVRLKYKDEWAIAPHILFHINPDLTMWDRPYSFYDLVTLFHGKMLKKSKRFVEYEDWEDALTDEGLYVRYDLDDLNKTLIQELKYLEIVIPELIMECDDVLVNLYPLNSFTVNFDFPEEIKISCEQYLIYFAQFLKDIGIDAETEIKEQARKTLFKVTPKNQEESLELIKEALRVYLNAPSTEDFESFSSKSNDISVLQWKSNVFHLKSQLTLASALLETKEETIEALRLANYQLEQRSKNISAKNNSEDEEELIEGIVAVTKLKTKGLSIDLPEIVRRLKRRFS